MKKVLMFGIITLAALVLCIGCEINPALDTVGAQTDKALTTAVSDAGPVDSKVIQDEGVIRYIPLEGGFYGIIGKQGNYDPINLPREFQQNGLRVKFTAKVCNDMASIHMWGLLVELLSMQTTHSERQLVMDQGVLHQYMIQGSPWVIKATTGGYQPLNLPDGFQVEGLKVNFVGYIRKDIIIIPPLWPLIQLTSISRIEEPLPVHLEDPFKLPVGKCAQEPRSQILLTFKEVLSDSRCPIGVECFWQGEAVVLVNVIMGGVNYGDFKLSTIGPSTVNVGRYYVEFLDLYPYPVANSSGAAPDYVGVFKIGSALEPLPAVER